MMIYVAFAFWLILLLLVGLGVYRLWVGLLRPVWVNWALLPGTVVSEMAYIFGCLITGGEIRRARLLDLPGSGRHKRGSGKGESQPQAQETPRLKTIGPIIATLMAIFACALAVVWLGSLLGGPVLDRFTDGGGLLAPTALPRTLPTSWGGFWDQLSGQVDLLRRMAESLGSANWLDWRVPVFVYLAGCLTIRLAPMNRPARPALAAVAVLAAAIAIISLFARGSLNLMESLWPLLTFLWSGLLFALLLTLLVTGLVRLTRVLIRGD